MGFPVDIERRGCIVELKKLFSSSEGDCAEWFIVCDASGISDSTDSLEAGDPTPMRVSNLEEPTSFGGTGGVLGRGGSGASDSRRFSITIREERLAGGIGVLEAGEGSLLDRGDGEVANRNWCRSSDEGEYIGGDTMGSGTGGSSFMCGGVRGPWTGDGGEEDWEQLSGNKRVVSSRASGENGSAVPRKKGAAGGLDGENGDLRSVGLETARYPSVGDVIPDMPRQEPL